MNNLKTKQALVQCLGKQAPRLLKNRSDIFIHDFEITKKKRAQIQVQSI